MANTYMLSDRGFVFSAEIDEANGVSAGDILVHHANNDAVTGTGISSYSVTDVKVSKMDANTDYQYPAGIALEDGDDDDVIAYAMQGIFIMKANEAITAGVAVQLAEAATQTVDQLDAANGEASHRFGRALTGASAQNKYLIVRVNV